MFEAPHRKTITQESFRPVLDVEVPSSWTRFSVSKQIGMIEEWMVGVEEELGIKPILYLSPSFADDVRPFILPSFDQANFLV